MGIIIYQSTQNHNVYLVVDPDDGRSFTFEATRKQLKGVLHALALKEKLAPKAS